MRPRPLLLLACGISFAAYSLALAGVDATRWSAAEGEANQFVKKAANLKAGFDEAQADFNKTNEIGRHLVGNVEGRLEWLELLKAINQCLPTDEHKPDTPLPPIPERNELHVTSLDCTQFEEIGQWYEKIRQYDQSPPTASPATKDPSEEAANADEDEEEERPGPQGKGWMIRLTGYHYHNADQRNQGAEFVRNTLIENLRTKKIKLPNPETHVLREVSMSDLGISYPVLVNPLGVEDEEVVDSNAVPVVAPAAAGMPARAQGSWTRGQGALSRKKAGAT